MLGLVLIRKKKLNQLINEAVDKMAATCYRLGFTMGQVEASNREYMEMFDIPSLVEKQAEIILEQKRRIK